MASILPQSELDRIKSDIKKIVQDTTLGTTIKYRQYTGETFTVTSQAYANPYRDWSGVSAIKGIITLDEARKVGGIQVGDTKFVFMQSSVSSALGVSDLIVESGVTYNLSKTTYDTLGIVYVCYGNQTV